MRKSRGSCCARERVLRGDVPLTEISKQVAAETPSVPNGDAGGPGRHRGNAAGAKEAGETRPGGRHRKPGADHAEFFEDERAAA
ncbi:hypothetical protein GA0115252_12502 [Streptomyces sp. DfronAA-171]|nr:hypothetical protein GA0115252_12502 [Streptomyces sp. DfronAA-171]